MLQRMLGPAGDAGQLGRGAGAPGGARAEHARVAEPAGGRGGRLHVPVHGRHGRVPRAGDALLADAARNGRARRARRGRGGSRERDAATGADRGELRPTTIEPGFMRTATGSALISVGRDARDLHRLGAGERAPLDGGQGHGLGDGRVRDAAGVDGRAQAARRDQGAPGRAHGRDPAPDRTVAARGGRLRGARRAHDLPGLRRAAGRRGHSVRVDHGRLRRAVAGVCAAARPRAGSSARR